MEQEYNLWKIKKENISFGILVAVYYLKKENY